jgi:GT2 family glycosyltransferase
MHSPSLSSSKLRIAVVIVNYNVKDLLVSCLASLEASLRGIPSEIIVVDNNSTDGSIDYAEPMFPSVRFMRLEANLGFGKANNIGFDDALERGAEYILCLNPDTLISEDTMQTMLEYMDAHAEVGVAGCKLLNADGTFQLACRRGFPTPWASFCKVFGLQALFPQSPLFAQYNQTFRSEDETYFVDAVMGAFMFIRREALEAVSGFDEDFFMYGEDLDLCFRIQQAGWKITYLHTTSIIHYKGESTRRSAINEVKHFYEAMEIFARKHYGSSWLFLFFLRAGIFVRSALAYLSLYRWEFGFAFADILAMNAAMLIGSALWKGRVFAFPNYAYPTVFIALSAVTLFSMIAAGEYSPYAKPSVRRAFSGLMISFFLLSALTYFFKDYAFSRGVLLLTIGIGIALTALTRIIAELLGKIIGGKAERRIAFLGDNKSTAALIAELDAANAASQGKRSHARIVGIITAGGGAGTSAQASVVSAAPIIGNMSYLRKIIEQHDIDEVIITDTESARAEIVRCIMEAASASGKSGAAPRRATFRFAQEYDDVIAGRIVEKYVNSIADGFSAAAPPVAAYNLAQWKYRALKRATDIIGAFFILTIGLPVVILWKPRHAIRQRVKNLLDVLRGTKSLIGLYAVESPVSPNAQHGLNLGKVGLTGLAHIHSAERLSPAALHNLNDFYVRRYSLWLDVDILLTLFFRLQRNEQQPQE